MDEPLSSKISINSPKFKKVFMDGSRQSTYRDLLGKTIMAKKQDKTIDANAVKFQEINRPKLLKISSTYRVTEPVKLPHI